MKRLIVCCEGGSGGRVSTLIAPFDHRGVQQITHIETGTHSGMQQHKVRRCFGAGITHDIDDAYRFLASHFAAGDEVWLFGVGRGAHTVCSLVGLIRNSGIVRSDHPEQIPLAYELYRNRSPETHPDSAYAAGFRESFAASAKVKFLAVGNVSECPRHPYSLADSHLRSAVESWHAFTAAGGREKLHPCLWQECLAAEEASSPGIPCEPEDHIAVGDPVLRAMISEATRCGLAFSFPSIPHPA